LFKFEREQKVFDLGGVKVGGQPGQYPTAMIGSIFYHGDKTVLNEKEGAFNREKAEALIKRAEEISEKTGNPSIIDIVGAWPEALARYIDFVADKTDSPFLVDGATSDVRVAGVKHVMEVGLANRAIYNTIMPEYKREEIDALKESGMKSAILLTFNPRMPTIRGRLEVLEELLRAAEEAGLKSRSSIQPSLMCRIQVRLERPFTWSKIGMAFQLAVEHTTPSIGGMREGSWIR